MLGDYRQFTAHPALSCVALGELRASASYGVTASPAEPEEFDLIRSAALPYSYLIGSCILVVLADIAHEIPVEVFRGEGAAVITSHWIRPNKRSI
jgi:hypothetical protein